MKKNFFAIVAIAFAIVSVSLTSCSKDEYDDMLGIDYTTNQQDSTGKEDPKNPSDSTNVEKPEIPSDSTNVTKPEDPTTPENPGTDKPEEPNTPGIDNPTTPENPGTDKPENPTTPENPGTTTPETPGNPGTVTPGTDNPGGDEVSNRKVIAYYHSYSPTSSHQLQTIGVVVWNDGIYDVYVNGSFNSSWNKNELNSAVTSASFLSATCNGKGGKWMPAIVTVDNSRGYWYYVSGDYKSATSYLNLNKSVNDWKVNTTFSVSGSKLTVKNASGSVISTITLQ